MMTFLSVFQKCQMEHLNSILALQDQVSSLLTQSDIFAQTSREEFEESLKCDFCVAAFCQGELALVSLMVINRITPRHLGNYLDYDEARLLRSATYDTTFVHPAYRGYCLQSLGIEIKDHVARQLGIAEILATISPYNPHSLNNAKAQGFAEVKRCAMYGGKERFISRKEL